MKRILYFAAMTGMLSVLSCHDGKKSGQEAEGKTGMPGDNLDLYATLELFKHSRSPQEFERKLNDKSGKVNNLDLNGDNQVDYIRVIDREDGDAHMLILRVPVSKEESQDAAVIEIKKNGSQTAWLQIIGDEDLYGKDYIVEPKKQEDAAGFVMVTSGVAVNVWMWPCVTYIYSPAYVVYESPWYWDYYPAWYDPWEPVAFEAYYPVVYVYHPYYYRPNGYRFVTVHENYYHVRATSPIVRQYRRSPGMNNYSGRNNGHRNVGRSGQGDRPVHTGPRHEPGMRQQQPGSHQRTTPGNRNYRQPSHQPATRQPQHQPPMHRPPAQRNQNPASPGNRTIHGPSTPKGNAGRPPNSSGGKTGPRK